MYKTITKSSVFKTLTQIAVTIGMFVGCASSAYAAGASARDLTVEQNAVYTVQNPQATKPSGLKVTAWVDHQNNTYAVGETVRIYVQSSKDAYITVLNVGASGKTTQLFPNQFETNNFVQANKPTEILASRPEVNVKVTGPVGNELIKVIASTAKKPIFSEAGTTAVGAFKSINGGAKAAARDLQVVMNESKPESGVEWDDYNKIIKTVEAAPVQVQPITFVPAFPAYVNSNATTSPALRLAADKNSYRIGESIQLAVSSDKACYLSLVNYKTDGQMAQIFPNATQPNNLMQAGQTLMIPSANSGVDMKAAGPVGINNIVAVCSTQNTQITPSFSNRKVAVRDLVLVANPPVGQPSSQSAQALIGFFITD